MTLITIIIAALMAPCIKCERLEPLTPTIPAPAPVPQFLSESAQGLKTAGDAFPGANVQNSAVSDVLMEAAAQHAQYQADQCTQGHQHWDRRYRELQRKMPEYRFAEIAAESWDRQQHDTMVQLGHEMFKCWKYSSGHWSVASKRHAYWGGAMAMGRNGIWYSAIIVAD